MRRIARLFTKPPHGDEAVAELRWGVAALTLVVAVLLACTVFYILPIGKSTYSALLPEAGSVRTGDDVRIAGIPVGEVTAIELLPDQVRIRFTVNHDVFVGDATTIEVRMLTAVGGHYLALGTSGTKPLGHKDIPAEHVRLPYSLMRAFQDAAAPAEKIDGALLRDNIAALNRALTDHPETVRRLTDTLTGLAGVLDRQRGDVSAALSVAAEYVAAVDDGKSLLGRLVTHIGGVENTLLAKRDEINTAVPLTIRLLSRIAALEPSYRSTLQPLLDAFAETLPALRQLGQRLDDMITTVHDLVVRLTHPGTGVTVDQTDPMRTRICIPLPDRGC